MNKPSVLIEAFRDELLRWNKQINLVSRQDTGDRLDSLFHQCQGGLDTLLGVLRDISKEKDGGLRLFYFDLGSGGGLPGIVWHACLSDAFPSEGAVQSWLVEPREKRAWFLNRLNRIKNMPSFGVLRGRWGDVGVSSDVTFQEEEGFSVFVLSLKALYLEDSDVLGGLRSAFTSFPEKFGVVIARYYPPDQLFDSDLIQQLQIPEPGKVKNHGSHTYTARGGGVHPLQGQGLGLASLVISSYNVSKF